MEHHASAPIERVIPGTQLVVHHPVYRHHGIYVGDGHVIHYSGWIGGRRGLIEEVSFENFIQGRPFGVERSPVDSISGKEVVRRARSRLGEQCYDLIKNNCEHFCNWCQFGEARSLQVELMSKPLLIALCAVQFLLGISQKLRAVPQKCQVHGAESRSAAGRLIFRR